MLSRRNWCCIAALMIGGLLAFDAFAGKGNGKGKGGGGGGGGGDLTNPALAYTESGEVRLAESGGSTMGLTSGADDAAPTWAPDASHICFLRFRAENSTLVDLYAVDPDGSGLALLYDFVANGEPHPYFRFGLSWSPDGTKILYSSDADNWDELWVLDVTTDQVQALGLGVDGRDLTGGSFGPDLDSTTPGFQGLVVYSLQEPGSDFVFDLHVVEVTTVDGSLVPDLMTDRTLVMADTQRFAEWSPDGTQIAFVDKAAFDGGRRLAVVGFDIALGTFGTPQVLSDQDVTDIRVATKPTWSPDGQWIAFRGDNRGKGGRKKGSSGIFRIRPDGTGLTNMLGGREPHWNPAWENDID